jgi:ornithine decarboxylase
MRVGTRAAGAGAKEITLDFRKVRAELAGGYDGPFLLLDLNIVRAKARRFMAAMPRVRPHYAVKANPHPLVLQTLAEEGVGFEIASLAELDLLLELGSPARETIYSNPVKARAHIGRAAMSGVKCFTIDSVEELRKVVAVVRDARLLLRIDTPNADSDWPLSGKFGAGLDEAREIIALAAQLRADVAGVTFHVGSQCRKAESWAIGIERAKEILDALRLAGMSPRVLDIGGGFPVQHREPIPSIEDIGATVNCALKYVAPEVRVIAEPGRCLVADAGWFVCRVTGITTRQGRRWMYWDAGIFGGLIESAAGMPYEIRTDRRGALVPWVVAGPTCDGSDVLKGEHLLPVDIEEGDFIYLPNTGAYTATRACAFNGFPLPSVRVTGRSGEVDTDQAERLRS